MRPQIDLDAGGWFIVAFIATAFGILPVLTVPLILGTGPIGDVAFLVAQGVSRPLYTRSQLPFWFALGRGGVCSTSSSPCSRSRFWRRS